MATSKIQMSEAEIQYNISNPYTDNAYWQHIIVKAWKFGNIVVMLTDFLTNSAGNDVTFPIALPSNITPSYDVHSLAAPRYSSTLTTINVTSGSQITVDNTLANKWYSALLTYVV